MVNEDYEARVAARIKTGLAAAETERKAEREARDKRDWGYYDQPNDHVQVWRRWSCIRNAEEIRSRLGIQ